MFKSARAMFLILGCLLVGVTLFTSFLFVDPVNRTHAFWYTISGILLSEVLLSLTVMDLGGNHKDHAFIYRFSSGIVSISYFVFTLIMLLAYWGDASAKTILLLEIIGLFIAIIAQVVVGLATRSVSEQSAKFKAERLNKRRFKIEIQSIKMDIAPFFNDNEKLKKQFSKLSDLARFAPESLDGLEDFDQEIFEGISRLEEVIEVKKEEEIETAVSKLISLFQKRQILAKESR